MPGLTKVFSVLALIVLMGLAGAATAQPTVSGAPPVPPIPNTDVFTQMRLDFAQKNSNPGWDVDPERERLFKTIQDKDYVNAFNLAGVWLEKTPVDAPVHHLRAYSALQLGDYPAHFRHLAFYYGLLRSITAQGDGRSPETAWKVIAVAEEYAVLRHLDAKVKEQSLLVGMIDQMECDLDGQSVTFYFDVKIPMAKVHEMLNPQEPDGGTPPSPPGQ
jgi:hypothetical protein